MNRTTLLVLCGKSASGKDTLVKYIEEYQPFQGQLFGKQAVRLKSETTRPPRGSQSGKSEYNFVSEEEFEEKVLQNKYLDHAVFNGWGYGTEVAQLDPEKINILITSPEGLRQIYDSNAWRCLEIHAFYLQVPFLVRLKRSFSREKKFKIEFLRRAWTDFWDFRDMEENGNSVFADAPAKRIPYKKGKNLVEILAYQMTFIKRIYELNS